jgi:hypothetical protein
MDKKVTITLSKREYNALCLAAKEQARKVSWQARWYVVQGLENDFILDPRIDEPDTEGVTDG